jgi:broad specificity phosphatase PhoE
MIGGPVTLVLIRHGIATGAGGCCIGRTDLPLSPEGEASVHRLGAAWHHAATQSAPCLASPTRVFASDLRRAVDSARALAAHWAVPVEIDERLREMDFGEWDGEAWAALEARDGERLQAWMADWVVTRTPRGESFADVVARVGDWLDAVRRERVDGSQTVVAVAHAGTIRAALCHLLGWPLASAFQARVDHARVTAIVLGAHGNELQFLNADRIPETS